MKLIIAVVQDQDVSSLVDEVTKNDFRVTKLASTGGFLREGNTTLLIGVEKEKVDDVLALIDGVCKIRKITTSLPPLTLSGDTYVPYPLEVKVGGATIFVIDIDRYEKI